MAAGEESIPWEAAGGYAAVRHGQPGPTLLQEGDGEFRCEECGNRCTVGPSGTEYGHERGTDGSATERCPRRPDNVDPTWDGETHE